MLLQLTLWDYQRGPGNGEPLLPGAGASVIERWVTNGPGTEQLQTDVYYLTRFLRIRNLGPA